MAILIVDNKDKKLDQLMIIVHDLVEIYAGDAFLYDEKKRAEAKEKELKTLIFFQKLLKKR